MKRRGLAIAVAAVLAVLLVLAGTMSLTVVLPARLAGPALVSVSTYCTALPVSAVAGPVLAMARSAVVGGAPATTTSSWVLDDAA